MDADIFIGFICVYPRLPAVKSNPMADNFFYGLEGRDLFKIYVDDVSLHGARIASNVYNAEIARAGSIHFGLIGWIVSTQTAKRVVKNRAEAEAKYDALPPGSPLFREGHKANFSLSSGEVQSAVVTPKAGGLKGAFSAGPTLELLVTGGKKRKFVLIENQNLAFIKNLLSRPIPMTTMSE